MNARTVWKALLYGGAGIVAGRQAWRVIEGRAEIERNRGLAAGKHFLILGAGFGGMSAAHELCRLLPDAASGEITLIDADNYLLFTPMLTEAAGGQLDIRHIVSPVRDLSPHIRFIEGRVTGIDLAEGLVTVESGSQGLDPVEQRYRADHIVIALGSASNFHHVPGVAERALTVKSAQDAAAICNRVLACLERACVENDPAKRRELLTFVVAGGGYTGVETMAAINDLVRDSVSNFPKAEATDIRTILIEPGDRLLPETTPGLASYAQGKLAERGVEVRLNAEVTSAADGYVEVDHQTRVPCRTLIWAAGVRPNPLVEQLNCAKSKHGAIEVSADCQVKDRANVWALGDCAAVPRPDDKGTYAPTAQNATRQGRLVARNIVARLHGRQTEPFRYKPVGQLALVGKHSGVASVFGLNFSGPIAWAMWRAVYLAKIPTMGQRARVLSDWLLDLTFGREPVPLVTTAAQTDNYRRLAAGTGA